MAKEDPKLAVHAKKAANRTLDRIADEIPGVFGGFKFLLIAIGISILMFMIGLLVLLFVIVLK